MRLLFILHCLLFLGNDGKAQFISLATNNIEAVNVFVSTEKVMGKNALRVVKDSAIKEVDEPTFVKITNHDFKNGIIEVKVLSRLLKNAPDFARAFIGIAFRIDERNSRYESIYIRPLNARVNDQVRRNHSIQYYSYPDFKFDRLRKEFPERYEAYADMEMNTWITMRIEVKETQAKLFLHHNKQPSLIVNDLKLGADVSGAIGLWVDVGTEGYFADLKVVKQ